MTEINVALYYNVYNRLCCAIRNKRRELFLRDASHLKCELSNKLQQEILKHPDYSLDLAHVFSEVNNFLEVPPFVKGNEVSQ